MYWQRTGVTGIHRVTNLRIGNITKPNLHFLTSLDPDPFLSFLDPDLFFKAPWISRSVFKLPGRRFFKAHSQYSDPLSSLYSDPFLSSIYPYLFLSSLYSDPFLKEVFAKNERGYRLIALKRRF